VRPQPPPSSGASRQACHAGGHAGRATRSRTVREFQTPSGPQDCALHFKPPPSSGASRQACHAGGRAGRATQSRTVREFQTPSAAKTGGVARRTARSTSSRRPQVEQAARLAMPAVTPAERHNAGRYGSSNAIRRQDWRRGTQGCALHLNPPPPCRGRPACPPLFSTCVSSRY